MTATFINHIEITQGVCGGKPRIAGHRIKVQDVVIWHERMGMSPDEIVAHYPSITLADVYAALSYYHDHLEEIRKDIEDDENFAREMQSKTPSLVQQKLNKQKGESKIFPSLHEFRNSLSLQGMSMSNNIMQGREDERY